LGDLFSRFQDGLGTEYSSQDAEADESPGCRDAPGWWIRSGVRG